jgi:predicted dehydrogenase
MYNYPNGRPDTMVYRKKYDHPIRIELDEMWIPDAFVGPMASLMEAIDKDETAYTNTRDNLNTLRVVEAAYLSTRENRSIRPEEIG